MTSTATGRMPTSASGAIRSTRRAAAYTVYPIARSLRAVASPMPEDAPVTMATLSVMIPPTSGIQLVGYHPDPPGPPLSTKQLVVG